MRVLLERTGGFAGISKKISVDTNTLPLAEAEELRQLVATADLFSLPEQIISSSSQSDRFQYQLTVEDNSQQHTIIVSEAALPTSLKPLIAWLLNFGLKA
ncbi:protealysin inhibitor emfourin [Nostoc sp. TCL26-01]|uniref:protealysin inhibitor emfourin n=1 Tax=Nostoc sp. TCL26-01 TaxID=2576904 RepID=UPI0015BB5D07|nr:protealysin inhibitor emfourin [Nostoc sp. TCL26-01]QLE57264.1 hypothetical protein FD725_18090 [Nostoc sp. TCL26-01]